MLNEINKSSVANMLLKQKVAVSDMWDMLDTLSLSYEDAFEDADLSEIEEMKCKYYDAAREGDIIKEVLALQEWAAQ